MNEWKNLDELKSFQELKSDGSKVDLTKAMAGEAGAERVAKYQVPMAAGLTYSYAAKQVDDGILQKLKALAEESQLAGKFEELYNGAVINTGEKRLVLHQLTRGQLGGPVMADVKSSTRKVRNLLRFVRLASAEAISVPVPCIWRWRTGRGRTTLSKWKRSSSATWIRMMQRQCFLPWMLPGRSLYWFPNPGRPWKR